MNENAYTFIGSCHAIEYNLADDAEAKDAISMLASVRVALLESLKASDPKVDLQTALRAHVVTLLEAVERLRENSKYQSLDSTLIELMNNYYNISDAIMGGGGGGGFTGSGSYKGSSKD